MCDVGIRLRGSGPVILQEDGPRRRPRSVQAPDLERPTNGRRENKPLTRSEHLAVILSTQTATCRMVDRLQTEQGRQGHLIDELAAGQAETNYLLNALANALASHFEAQPANKKAAS